MYDQIVDKRLNEIRDVEMFFTSYQSTLLFYNTRNITEHLPPSIKSQIEGKKIAIAIRDNPPSENDPEIPDAFIYEKDELHNYMLHKGQFQIFENSIKILCSILESFFRDCLISNNPSVDTSHVNIHQNTIEKIGIPIIGHYTSILYRLRELRNCYTHNCGIYDVKAAKKLSKEISQKEDPDYVLVLKTLNNDHYGTKVNQPINLPVNSSGVFRWFTREMGSYLFKIKGIS